MACIVRQAVDGDGSLGWGIGKLLLRNSGPWSINGPRSYRRLLKACCWRRVVADCIRNPFEAMGRNIGLYTPRGRCALCPYRTIEHGRDACDRLYFCSLIIALSALLARRNIRGLKAEVASVREELEGLLRAEQSRLLSHLRSSGNERNSNTSGGKPSPNSGERGQIDPRGSEREGK
jgi:hypothetical protein